MSAMNVPPGKRHGRSLLDYPIASRVDTAGKLIKTVAVSVVLNSDASGRMSGVRMTAP